MSKPRPPFVGSIIDELLGDRQYASMEEVNRALTVRVREYNTRPQAALGGLSPEEMSLLLSGDWMTNGALRLDGHLTPDELADAAFLADVRTVLDYFAGAGRVKETQARNLPRAVVADLVPLLRILARSPIDEQFGTKVPLNEGDVLWLAVLRHTLMAAGLLVRRKGLGISTIGRELLRIDRSGALYSLLFRSLFRRIDLRALDMSGRHAGLQQTLAYSFYTLRSAAREWSSTDVLAHAAWLESAKDPMSDADVAYGDLRNYTFRHRVLDPLANFGLLEVRELPTEESWRKNYEFKTTPLYDRFMRFELPPRPHGDLFLLR